MPANTSRISGFHKLSREERFDRVCGLTGISAGERAAFEIASKPMGEMADHLSENVIGTMNIPIGIATNLVVDGEDVLVPMATEESSVIAAVCNGARQCRDSSGITTSKDENCMIGQIQISDLANPFGARAAVFEHQDEIKSICDDCDPLL